MNRWQVAVLASTALVGMFLVVASEDAPVPGTETETDQSLFGTEARVLAERRVWQTVIADFNGDGNEDVLIGGHGEGDAIWYWSAEGYSPGDWVLPDGRDRHSCTAADFDNNGTIDLYCSTGAFRGEGARSNELFFQSVKGEWKEVLAHGAEDEYGRGRLVSSLNFDADEYPDLFTTNWEKPRADGRPNHSQVFINNDGQNFTALGNISFSVKVPVCLQTIDWDLDGLDDVFACDASKGATAQFFLSSAGWKDSQDRFFDESYRWRVIEFADVIGNSRPEFIGVRGGPESVLEIFEYRANGFLEKRFSFTDGGYLSDVALADINGDGILDLYLARRQSYRCNTENPDLEDLILLGPDFEADIRITGVGSGCSNEVGSLDGRSFLVSRAGPGWKGEVVVYSGQ